MRLIFSSQGKYFYDATTLEIDGRPGEFHAVQQPCSSDLAAPMLMRDTPTYESPLSGKMVDGRVQRREEMKRFNVREVDPGEFKPCYRNHEFAKKHGIHESKWGEPLKRVERKADPVPENNLLKSA